MDSIAGKRAGSQRPSRMGSEYTDAPTYLAQVPRPLNGTGGGKKRKKDPQHGSNDSDFGMPDQAQD